MISGHPPQGTCRAIAARAGVRPENPRGFSRAPSASGSRALSELDTAVTVRRGRGGEPRFDPQSGPHTAFGRGVDRSARTRELLLDPRRAAPLRHVGRLRPGTPYALNFPDQVPVDGTRHPPLCARSTLSRIRRPATCPSGSTSRPDGPGKADDSAGAHARDAGARRPAPAWRSTTSIQSFMAQEGLACRDRHWRCGYLHRRQGRPPDPGTGRPAPSPWLAGFDVDDFGGSVPRLVKAAGGRCWSPNFKDLRADTVAEAHRRPRAAGRALDGQSAGGHGRGPRPRRRRLDQRPPGPGSSRDAGEGSAASEADAGGAVTRTPRRNGQAIRWKSPRAKRATVTR